MCSLRTQWLKQALRDCGPLSLILAAHLPLVVVHFGHLWQTGLHSHFPLILAAVGVLLWSRWDGECAPSRWRAIASAIVLVGGFLFLLFGVLIWSPWMGYFGTLMTSAALLLRVCPAPLKEWFPAWLLLWLLIPLPMGLDRQLAIELQTYSTQAASLLLDFFHVNHLQSGNIIEVPAMRFSVEEACSGINSLFVLVSATAVLAVLRRHGWLHAIGLIIASMVWAVVANMLRIAGVIVAASQFGLDLSTGWRHQLWGFTLFAIAFGMILSTDRILWVLLGPADDQEDERADANVAAEVRGQRSEVRDQGSEIRSDEMNAGELDSEPEIWPARLGIFQSWMVAGMFVGLGIMQSLPRATHAFQPYSPPAIGSESFGEQTLPAEIAGWRRTRFELEHRGPGNTNGEYSAVWRFERLGREAIVSLDYPFVGWHQLTECYRGRGCRSLTWNVERLNVERLQVERLAATTQTDGDSKSDQESFAVVTMELDPARCADLLFVEWNESGTLLEPPVSDRASIPRLVDEVKRRWGGSNPSATGNHTVYQLQVLSPASRGSTSAKDLASLRQLFVESLRVLRPQTVVAAGGAQ